MSGEPTADRPWSTDAATPRATPVPLSDRNGSFVLRIALGARLRRLREAAGVSRDDAAEVLRATAPKISRMELGRSGLKPRDVADLLDRYRVLDPAERAEFLDLVRHSNVEGWWQRYRDLLPAWFETYLGMEQAATLIRTFEVQFVPALLQTEEYARAAVRLSHRDEAEVERRVALRLRRQQVLAAPEPPQVWAVLDEAVLRRPMAGPRPDREQLRHLLELNDLPNVSLQIAALDRGPHPATGGAFTILRFPSADLPDVVYLEQLNSALYVDKARDVEDYVVVWNTLCTRVDPPTATADTLRRILDERFR